MSYLIILCAAALIIYGIYATVQKARGKEKSSCCGTAETVQIKKVSDTDRSHYPYTYQISVDGMMCSNCAANVENALNAIGDTWAHVELGRHRAEVLAKSPKSEEDFRSALIGTPYRVTSFAEKQQ